MHSLYCCGFEQKCKVYELPTKKAWKRLYFLDRCGICAQCVASLVECNNDGKIHILKRYTGKKAIHLRDKLTNKVLIFEHKTGSMSGEQTFYNDMGIIYNFNRRKVGTNQDFIKPLI